MNLIQIDIVEPKAFQARLDAVHDVVARQADRVWPRCGSAAHLGCDDNTFAGHLEIAQRPTENLLGKPLRINVGGVDEIDARRERPLDQGIGVILIDLAHVLPPRALAAERHGAQADFRHIKAGPAQRTMFHGCTPFLWSPARGVADCSWRAASIGCGFSP